MHQESAAREWHGGQRAAAAAAPEPHARGGGRGTRDHRERIQECADSKMSRQLKRNFLDLSSLSPAELNGLLALGARLKSEPKNGLEYPHLRGRPRALAYFEA